LSSTLINQQHHHCSLFDIRKFTLKCPLDFRKRFKIFDAFFWLVVEEMDTFECIKTKLDVREFSAEDIPVEAIYPSGEQTESQDVGKR